MDQKLADVVVESTYAQAMQKDITYSTEGGLFVEDRWFDAIAEAYKQGHEDTLQGLHK